MRVMKDHEGFLDCPPTAFMAPHGLHGETRDGSVTPYTRREFNGLVVGGLAAAPFVGGGAAQKAASSKFAGVRLGTQSYSFRDRSLDEAIAGMAAVGISYCELWSAHAERGAMPTTAAAGSTRREAQRKWRLDPATIDYFKSIRAKFDNAGVTLTSYDVPFANDFTDEEIAATFAFGKALGVNVITSSSKVSVAPRVAPVAAKATMKVGFHNHSNIAPDEFARPEDWATAMAAGPNIAMTLDIGHFTAANFDALAFLEQHHDHIVSMHIKDRKRDQGANVPFGTGDTPIVAVLKKLRDNKWDIPAHMEFEYTGDTLVEMRRCLDYCKTVLESK